ncbi:MAG: exodeoxyribonuclease VII large subunit, partial [Clostridia bacterium]
MEDKALSVTQINNYIKNVFDAEELLQNIKIYGEISGYSVMRGIAYFNLKDENAIISCVCFSADKFLFVKNGDQVVLSGSTKFYAKGGRLNFNVTFIEQNGQGLLFKQFLELKARLENEGLFDKKNKKELPSEIKTIGVVTSEGGAVIQDIINVTSRRDPTMNIVLYPVKVQGQNAEKEVCEGIRFFNDYAVDLIIVARGGGSLEDLQPFNTELVARTVFESQKVVVSAVGHETDFTIIDFVADLRAPTPSAAAELVSENKMAVKQKFVTLLSRFKFNLNQFILSFQNNIKLNALALIDKTGKLLFKQEKTNEQNKSKIISLCDSYLNEKYYQENLFANSIAKLN